MQSTNDDLAEQVMQREVALRDAHDSLNKR